MRALLLAAAVAALTASGANAAPAIASGAYDNTLLLGVDPTTGTVSGYFSMTEDRPPTFSCVFYLKGRLSGGSAKVETYFPDDPKGDLIRGTLGAQASGKVRVTLPTEHGGCANLWQFANATEPADFELQTARPWTSVRVVKSAKAYFYASPSAVHGKAYMVKGDGVGVLAAQPGWVQAEFVGEKRTSSGWLREIDLYAP